ncbi:MAG: hypothetical protein ACLU9T_02115 [Blautia faecis]
MSTAQIGQDTYGLALNTNTKILFYNVKAFQKMPDFLRRSTMDEFIEGLQEAGGRK